MIDRSPARKMFRVLNALFLCLMALLCLLPMYHVLCLSFSSSPAVLAGKVSLWPVGFTTKSYEYIMSKNAYWRAMGMSFLRVGLGVPVSMLCIILAAYPLSKSKLEFPAQPSLIWFFLFTMLFSGGMIPAFMVVRNTGLIDTIWALIIPCAMNAYDTLLLMNFFRAIPRDIEESALIDGASQWRILFQIYVPLSLPSIATLAVFIIVGHWNSWFDGMLYMNSEAKYPLQTYLQASLATNNNVRLMTKQLAMQRNAVSDRTLRSAEIFIASVPVLVVYPFLQKYFISGMTLGGVKE